MKTKLITYFKARKKTDWCKLMLALALTFSLALTLISCKGEQTTGDGTDVDTRDPSHSAVDNSTSEPSGTTDTLTPDTSVTPETTGTADSTAAPNTTVIPDTPENTDKPSVPIPRRESRLP